MEKQRVKIVPSVELTKWKLKSLVGRTGCVVENGEKGEWVKLDKPYQDEQEWFVPNKSLQIVPFNE